ncbi:alpha/beta fold hydrolase [Actinoplanes sp. G11-F43]|uniref:alpha/beta fold hydrolase n=1 Tax=Actinoplanes sp. G11-F43 TaxID=3424130 RepID=UPI003D3414FE
MPGTLPIGPLETMSIAGVAVPSYVVPFDRSGASMAPLTERDLVRAAADATDVYVFSHGWNNDWDGALRFYRNFMTEFGRVVTRHGPVRPGARPLFVGIFWPSIAMPEHEGPSMAADMTDRPDTAGLEALADEVGGDRAELYALAQEPSLSGDRARRFAELLRPLYRRTDADLEDPDPDDDPEAILRLWRELREQLDAEESGPEIISGPGGGGAVASGAGPTAAGLPGFLDPRNIIRLGTVLLMKDRAGTVGAHGVNRLLAALLGGSGARVHLVGHSYGCRVVLSGLCGGPLPRPVRSVLLLQPALSYLAFAGRLPGSGAPGGYRPALARCELPVVVTWTRRDVPLRQLFHLAVRRAGDAGDRNIGAAGLETPPSRFAAMGGWGPQAAPGVLNVPIRRPADGRYQLTGPEILALESHPVITGHSDIIQEATAWALYNLASA